MTNQEKLNELLKNKDFTRKLYACKELEDLQAFLKENGVEMSDSDIAEIKKTLGELPDEKVSEVSGGSDAPLSDKPLKEGPKSNFYM